VAVTLLCRFAALLLMEADFSTAGKWRKWLKWRKHHIFSPRRKNM